MLSFFQEKQPQTVALWLILHQVNIFVVVVVFYSLGCLFSFMILMIFGHHKFDYEVQTF